MNYPKSNIVSMAPPALSRKEKRAMKHLPGNSKRDQLRKWFVVLYRYYKDTNDLGVYWRLEKIIPYTRVRDPISEGIAEVYEDTAKWVEEFSHDIRMYEKEKGREVLSVS